MAAAATVTIAGTVTGLPSGTKTLTGTLTSVAAVGTVQELTLASGANTVTVPTGATAVLITPPAGNTVLVTLKGVTGDTGVPLHKTFPTLLPLDSTVTTFCLTAASLFASPVELNWM